jgi:hypothetical protein
MKKIEFNSKTEAVNMKKLLITLLAAVAISAIAVSQAQAANSFDYFKMVTGAQVGSSPAFEAAAQAYNDASDPIDGNRDNAVQQTYDYTTETPYLYVHLTSAATEIYAWLSPTSASFSDIPTELTQVASSGLSRWFSLTNWSTVKEMGQWTVTGSQFGGTVTDNLASCQGSCAATSFVVTPEPMSMILFGMGGLPIAAHLLRRRKVTV